MKGNLFIKYCSDNSCLFFNFFNF